MECFILDWCEVAELGMTSLSVVEDLEVLEYFVGQIDPGFPLLSVGGFNR